MMMSVTRRRKQTTGRLGTEKLYKWPLTFESQSRKLLPFRASRRGRQRWNQTKMRFTDGSTFDHCLMPKKISTRPHHAQKDNN